MASEGSEAYERTITFNRTGGVEPGHEYEPIRTQLAEPYYLELINDGYVPDQGK